MEDGKADDRTQAGQREIAPQTGRRPRPAQHKQQQRAATAGDAGACGGQKQRIERGDGDARCRQGAAEQQHAGKAER
jgi:hypothetical protein